MKNKLLALISVLFLMFTSPAAHAGFVIPKTAATEQSSTAAQVFTSANVSEAKKEKASTFNALVSKMTSFPKPYRVAKMSEWIGIAALGAGIIGLIVPGVNLLAITLGALGLGRGCKAQGLATAGFILGILELILFLLAGVTVVSLILL